MVQPTSFLTAADPRGETPRFFSVWWGGSLEDQVRVCGKDTWTWESRTRALAGMWGTGLCTGDGHYPSGSLVAAGTTAPSCPGRNRMSTDPLGDGAIGFRAMEEPVSCLLEDQVWFQVTIQQISCNQFLFP